MEGSDWKEVVCQGRKDDVSTVHSHSYHRMRAVCEHELACSEPGSQSEHREEPDAARLPLAMAHLMVLIALAR
eukprot:scaffold217361_cov37-Tisochrysis_lutea.AAC.4